MILFNFIVSVELNPPKIRLMTPRIFSYSLYCLEYHTQMPLDALVPTVSDFHRLPAFVCLYDLL